MSAESTPTEVEGGHPGYRIFIIGAGFSVAAGLPTAQELFPEIKTRVENRYGTDTKFHRDIDTYLNFREQCDRVTIDPDQIDLEQFLAYLDVEHFLGFRGPDTWSDEGNETQVLVKKYIGKIIHERTPTGGDLPNFYAEFARNLSTTDIVITFNYDTVLESAFELIGKPYRLFPHRYKQVSDTGGIIDDSIDEVVLLKPHGSIDWFNRTHYEKLEEGFRRRGEFDIKPQHAVFGDPDRFGPRKLVDGPRPFKEPLSKIYKVDDPLMIYAADEPLETPSILAPSNMKIVYSQPFQDFWWGVGQAGGFNLGVSVIGFSLPEHDDYARIALHQIISNYQYSGWDESFVNRKKDYVRLVDYRMDDASRLEYQERYGFVEEERSQVFFDGFGDSAVGFLFDDPRV